jgi:hypothetical protein
LSLAVRQLNPLRVDWSYYITRGVLENIEGIVWLERFVEKLAVKHQVTTIEVEEV